MVVVVVIVAAPLVGERGVEVEERERRGTRPGERATPKKLSISMGESIEKSPWFFLSFVLICSLDLPSNPRYRRRTCLRHRWSGGSPSRWTTWEPREKKRKVKSMVWILMLFFQLLVAPAEPPKRPLRVHRGVELCVDLSRQGALESESEQARSARRLKEVLLARLSLPKRGESSWSRKISGIRRRKKPRPRPLCFYAASRSSAKRDER